MGDSWEDWDDEEVAVPAVNGTAAPETFEDEDAEEEAPKWKDSIPKPQQAKPRISKYDESRGAQAPLDDGPLDDPIAEKLRQQLLVEEADYQSTMELFGNSVDLETFVPKSSKDFEDYGKAVAAKYLMPYSKVGSVQYKSGIKALLHAALRSLTAAETKDIETVVSGIRSDKLKSEKAAMAGKKTQKKASLNVGKSGGSAGLDDVLFEDDLDDDFDFM